MVRAHFSQWGTVNDVYFPRHKKTLKRRPFCFVTFANKEDAERALSMSGLEIGGVAIKNLTMVEDRCAN
jgi:RNA recognition motif-containing protein